MQRQRIDERSDDGNNAAAILRHIDADQVIEAFTQRLNHLNTEMKEHRDVYLRNVADCKNAVQRWRDGDELDNDKKQIQECMQSERQFEAHMKQIDVTLKKEGKRLQTQLSTWLRSNAPEKIKDLHLVNTWGTSVRRRRRKFVRGAVRWVTPRRWRQAAAESNGLNH
jgi:hypothetical protein